MATLGLKEMGKFLWEGREKGLPCWLSKTKLRQVSRLAILNRKDCQISYQKNWMIKNWWDWHHPIIPRGATAGKAPKAHTVGFAKYNPVLLAKLKLQAFSQFRCN